MRKVLSTVFGIAAVTTLLVPAAAHANNDVTLQRFGECARFGSTDLNCLGVTVYEDEFRLFAREFGLVWSPLGMATPETLGIAGFSFQIDHHSHSLNSNARHWQLADADRAPADSMQTTSFHFRKGLPFSVELGGMVQVLWDSELSAIGLEAKWALHEDYLWPLPDLAIRGFVSTVLGHSQLSLITPGLDVVTGIPIGLADAFNLTPYAGYSATWVVSSSRLIDATPGDPSPPVDNTTDPTQSNAPEFVFDVKNELVHRAIGGIRVQFTLVNVLLQGTFGGGVTTWSGSLGLDF